MLKRKKEIYNGKQSEIINNLLKENDTKGIWKFINKTVETKRRREGPNREEWESYVRRNEQGEEREGEEYMGDERYITLESGGLDEVISKEELRRGVKRMRGDKAIGEDLVQGRIWKELLKEDKYLDIMVKIFNKLFESNKIPERWKIGEVVPIYKNKGKREDPNNYRNISILSSLMKLYTGILATRLNNWAEKFNIVSKWQNRFRKNRRIMDNIIIIQSVSEKYLSRKRGKMYWAFIDL